jgi:DNA-binding transcriptional MerR regulator
MSKVPPKAPDAFRTIGEVAEFLETPAHVLRFWESRFPQVKPVKRAGGRRYYRPDDVALLAGIKSLLQDQGMTIKGVQRLLAEQGVRHVASLGPLLPTGAVIDADWSALPEPADEIEGQIPDAGSPIRHAPEPVDPAHETAPETAPETARETAPATADAAARAAPAEPAPAHATAPAWTDAAPVGAPETPTPPLPRDMDAPRDGALAPAARIDPAPQDPPARGSDPRPTAPLSGAPAMSELAPPVADSPAPVAREPAPPPRLAQGLRALTRGTLGHRREQYQMVARKLDMLLDRMSEASGAGRW